MPVYHRYYCTFSSHFKWIYVTILTHTCLSNILDIGLSMSWRPYSYAFMCLCILLVGSWYNDTFHHSEYCPHFTWRSNFGITWGKPTYIITIIISSICHCSVGLVVIHYMSGRCSLLYAYTVHNVLITYNATEHCILYDYTNELAFPSL